MTVPVQKPTSLLSTCFEPLLLRHPTNPILTKKDWPYPINSVFNAGATLLADGTTLLLCRAEDRRGLSQTVPRGIDRLHSTGGQRTEKNARALQINLDTQFPSLQARTLLQCRQTRAEPSGGG